MITGWLSSGDRDSSEKVLLDGDSYSNTNVAFSTSETQNLFDSILEAKDGRVVKISSKGGNGAAASIKAVEPMIKFFKEKEPQKFEELTKNNKRAIEIIDTILQNNQYIGPVELAKKMNLIDEQDHSLMLQILKNKNLDLESFKQSVKLTDKLLKLTKEFKGVTPYEIETPEIGYSPVLHVLAGIAKEAAKTINSDEQFHNVMKELLSHSNLIQVNSTIKIVGENKKDCQFTKFQVKYPPTFTGKVYAHTGKNYSASEVKGRIGFIIK